MKRLEMFWAMPAIAIFRGRTSKRRNPCLQVIYATCLCVYVYKALCAINYNDTELSTQTIFKTRFVQAGASESCHLHNKANLRNGARRPTDLRLTGHGELGTCPPPSPPPPPTKLIVLLFRDGAKAVFFFFYVVFWVKNTHFPFHKTDDKLM